MNTTSKQSKQQVLYHIYTKDIKNNYSEGYIGISNNFDARYKQHSKALKAGVHYNSKLQSFFDTSDEVYMDIIGEYDTRKEVLDVEQMYRPRWYMALNNAPGGIEDNSVGCSGVSLSVEEYFNNNYQHYHNLLQDKHNLTSVEATVAMGDVYIYVAANTQPLSSALVNRGILLVSNKLRAQDNQYDMISFDDIEVEDVVSIEDTVVDIKVKEQVKDVVLETDNKHLYHYIYDRMKQEDISTTFGIPVSTTKTQVNRGKKQVVQIMKDRESGKETMRLNVIERYKRYTKTVPHSQSTELRSIVEDAMGCGVNPTKLSRYNNVMTYLNLREIYLKYSK